MVTVMNSFLLLALTIHTHTHFLSCVSTFLAVASNAFNDALIRTLTSFLQVLLMVVFGRPPLTRMSGQFSHDRFRVLLLLPFKRPFGCFPLLLRLEVNGSSVLRASIVALSVE